MSLTIEINGNKYEAAQGETILTVSTAMALKYPHCAT